MSVVSYAKLTLGFGVLLFLLAILFEAADQPAHAASYDVCASSEACGYHSIQAAVRAAPSGGTVTVAPGVYNESVVIDHPITLVGPQMGRSGERALNQADEAIINGVAVADSYKTALSVNAPDVTVDGFVLGADSPSATDLTAGVLATGSATNFTLRSSVVRNLHMGVSMVDAKGARIDNVAFRGNDLAIYGARLSDVAIGMEAPVWLYGGASQTGAAFEWSKGVRFGSVTVQGLGTPVSLYESDDVTMNGQTHVHITQQTLEPTITPPSTEVGQGGDSATTAPTAEASNTSAPAAPGAARVITTPQVATLPATFGDRARPAIAAAFVLGGMVSLGVGLILLYRSRSI